jgi:basic membrane lipoprotein Med (substrate-binding protein (PBP1-ABC) superfamily)
VHFHGDFAGIHVAGDFPSANYWLGMEDDVVFTADWNPDIPAKMVEQITARQAEIASGDFVVFEGPLIDQTGTERVADGVAMTDDEIISMDWHVDGVTTPLPS